MVHMYFDLWLTGGSCEIHVHGSRHAPLPSSFQRRRGVNEPKWIGGCCLVWWLGGGALGTSAEEALGLRYRMKHAVALGCQFGEATDTKRAMTSPDCAV